MPDNIPGLPADLVRGLTSARMNRRSLLRLGGLSALGLGLAACSIPAQKVAVTTDAKQQEQTKAFWAAQKKTGQLDFANWALYMDVSDNNKNDHPSLDLFTKKTGIKVNYQEVIQEDGSFFAKIQPLLAAGQSTNYDLMVITNGLYLDKLMALDYLIPLDQSRMTTFDVTTAAIFKSPSYDPGNKYTMAWQSGITGIAYDPKKTGRDLTSWKDLLDPKFKGKVGMFGDNEDLPSAGLLAVGVPPETSTPADWKKAAAWLTQQRDSGVVRKYYEGDYIDPLSKGDLWASQAWSGDVFQANASGANLKFVVPSEGGVLWTDNMCIPKHAKHPLDAMIYMDFVYQPEIAAMLAEYINYITPVPAAAQVIASDAKAATGDNKTYLDGLVTSPLVFPTLADFTKLHRYRVLTTAEEQQWNALFEPVYQS